jgi:hypothetical protein
MAPRDASLLILLLCVSLGTLAVESVQLEGTPGLSSGQYELLSDSQVVYHNIRCHYQHCQGCDTAH